MLEKSSFPPYPFPSPAAAAAKLLQLCPTLCNPIDGSPPGSPVPSPSGLSISISLWFILPFSGRVACGIFAPQPGIGSVALAVETES